MLILTIRTDKPEAEIGLYEDMTCLANKKWQAHRQLAETIHVQITKILQKQSKEWADIEAVVCFKGPGSFTGLRIGLTIGNTLSYSLGIPIVGSDGEEWIKQGIAALQKDQNETVVIPKYGAEANITKPRK